MADAIELILCFEENTTPATSAYCENESNKVFFVIQFSSNREITTHINSHKTKWTKNQLLRKEE